MRSVHRAPRRRRRPLVPRVRRAGRGRRDHDRRRPRRRRPAEPGAGGVPGRARPAVRVLHARLRRFGDGAARPHPCPDRPADPRGPVRQPLPLHRLPGDPPGGPPSRRLDAGADDERSPAPRRPASSASPSTARRTGACSPGTASTSTTSRCPACSTPRSCAATSPRRRSLASTRRQRAAAARRRRRVHRGRTSTAASARPGTPCSASSCWCRRRSPSATCATSATRSPWSSPRAATSPRTPAS